MTRFAIPAICLFAAAAAFGQSKKPAPPKISKAELQAVQAMLQAQTPDDRIKAADDLTTKFADTTFKSFALYQEADSYEQKGDHTKAIVFSEQALQADPKNFDADVLLALVTARQTRDTDLDKAEKLARADKAANEALETLKTAEKPAVFQMTDEQWTQAKNMAASQAWQALGTSAQVQNKLDEAIADYEKGLAVSPDPILMLSTGRALIMAKKYDDAIGWFDKAAASPQATPQIKNIAATDKARAEKGKSMGAPAPAKASQE